jgi:hypothetical protein
MSARIKRFSLRLLAMLDGAAVPRDAVWRVRRRLAVARQGAS